MERLILVGLGIFLAAGCNDTENAALHAPNTPAPVPTSTEAGDLSGENVNVAGVDSRQLLAASLKQAHVSNKRVLVHLGAPW